MKNSTSPRIRELLDDIANSRSALVLLRAHARQRLARARHSLPAGALQHLDADDLVQQALAETFRGTLTPMRGRHPKAQHLTDAAAFTRWLGSVINSLVANHRAALATRARRAELAVLDQLACPAVAVRDQVDFRMRLAELLKALRQEFAHRPVILALLDRWERDGAHLDRLPGKPFNAHVVRQATRRLLKERPELRP